MTVTEQSGRNGVDTDALFATINVVKGQRELAKFQFRAHSDWVNGTHSRVRAGSFDGAGGTHEHKAAYESGRRPPRRAASGPTKRRRPSSTCSSAWPAASRPASPTSHPPGASRCAPSPRTVEGDIDLQGILGLLGRPSATATSRSASASTIDADAPAAKIRRDRRPVTGPFRCLRRAHQRRARHDRRHVRADHAVRAAGRGPAAPRPQERPRATHRHDHRGCRPSRSRSQQLAHRRRPRPRAAGARAHRRALAFRTLGLAAAPHAELDDTTPPLAVLG